jgi:hypothetical protein
MLTILSSTGYSSRNFSRFGKAAKMADWRVDNAKHTVGQTLYFKKYKRPSESWDHDHCEACWATFMETDGPEILTEGYATHDEYRWICSQCFQDLKEEMNWTLGN